MTRPLFVLAAVALAVPASFAQRPAPSIDDVLNLKRAGSPAISPDGRWVAFTVREADWTENEFQNEIWLADTRGGAPRQLTNAPMSSTAPAFSPDGKFLGFLSNRSSKQQIYRISMDGGEASALTSLEDGVQSFTWSPDGLQIAMTTNDPVSEAVRARQKTLGDFSIEDAADERRYRHLHVLDVATRQVRRLTSGDFVVGAFDWSPDGRRIAFDHRASADPSESDTADISVVDVASGDRTAVVTQRGQDSNPRWSPDGRRIAFASTMAKPFPYYQNNEIAVVTPGSDQIVSLTASFDENPALIAWTKAGIFFSASQRTWAYLFRLDPVTKAIVRHAVRDEWIGSGFDLTTDGSRVAFIGAGPSAFADVYVAAVAPTLAARQVSRLGDQVADWPKHAREVYRWKSQDGAAVEGVLHKPADFRAGQRYPLLIVIHGGPTGISRPVPYSNGSGYYPIDAWLSRGAIVLEPNYRGSAGYGEAFRSLNVRNLGIGDAWDVLSGIDQLVADGLADAGRVGSMGWSQGGYISAFLTTRHSDRFRAVSVGAGISNWVTYYVNTDIHPFTRQYLKATPWEDPKIYADTSPMTYIRQAKTPTLIQHKEGDERVPVPNAYELYQGLRDQDVPVRLVIYPGAGHGITLPKSNRAAMQQNDEWFTRYVLK